MDGNSAGLLGLRPGMPEDFASRAGLRFMCLPRLDMGRERSKAPYSLNELDGKLFPSKAKATASAVMARGFNRISKPLNEPPPPSRSPCSAQVSRGSRSRVKDSPEGSLGSIGQLPGVAAYRTVFTQPTQRREPFSGEKSCPKLLAKPGQ